MFSENQKGSNQLQILCLISIALQSTSKNVFLTKQMAEDASYSTLLNLPQNTPKKSTKIMLPQPEMQERNSYWIQLQKHDSTFNFSKHDSTC